MWAHPDWMPDSAVGSDSGGGFQVPFWLKLAPRSGLDWVESGGSVQRRRDAGRKMERKPERKNERKKERVRPYAFIEEASRLCTGVRRQAGSLGAARKKHHQGKQLTTAAAPAQAMRLVWQV